MLRNLYFLLLLLPFSLPVALARTVPPTGLFKSGADDLPVGAFITEEEAQQAQKAQNTSIDNSVTNTSPQCVDDNEHPHWKSVAGNMKAADCVAALAELHHRVGPAVRRDHMFYSKKVYPEAAPGGTSAWALPDGAQNGDSSSFFHLQSPHC